MVLTTGLVCLRKAMRCLAGDSRQVRSLGLQLLSLCLVVLTGCGTGGNAGDGALVANPGNGQAKGLHPTISMSPTNLAFSAVQGGSNPPGQAVAISNSGNGSLNWTASTTAPWIALSSLSGAAPGSFNVTAIVAGLAAGTYSTTIIVAATGAMNTPQTIPVTFTVSASSPITPPTSTATISLNPTSLTFSAIQGGTDPAGQAVAISNSASGTLTWSVSTTASWLTLSPLSGTAPSSFNATASISGLAAGTYSTTITVTATGATNTPQTIPVTATVSAPPPTTSTSTSATTASPVSLAWDAETDPTVVGYYMHYGTQSPNSPGSCVYALSSYYPITSLSNASLPSVAINNLTAGTTYYFAVSAYNGVESACSNEVSKAT